MPDDPIKIAGQAVDLSNINGVTTAVVASPALAAETVIATLVMPAGFRTIEGLLLDGWAAFTVGTSGTACRLRIRRTDINGTVIGDTGALTGGIAAAALVAQDVSGSDATPVQTYVLTLQVTAGAAASTVSAVRLTGVPI